ncbi:hypothetical protein CDG77_23255 [Nostoc sp. 'Peltigera membranacea cyanobiont' 213]|uniref:hypothetical protein n=1 Tax=Nostoc sp. 'Peltigera membranacea cyanobiont' 213 TaxID=2014530 RepID=UPI000B958E13|nr:hypothetical protein [Nostoc sp. 'Peltigera membranacea cyanobiont' 213]OYD88535.1 hypothetical protein CDG77_23255 [Nostoc sp. 'Peltigera membranacea cyanobiont' 213]
MLKLLPKFAMGIATAALSTGVIGTSLAQNSTVSYDFTINVTKGSLLSLAPSAERASITAWGYTLMT